MQGVAAFWSLIIVGVGQMYCGAFLRGLVFMLIAAFGGLTIPFGVGIFILVAVWTIAPIDAYKLAQRVNAGEKFS